MRATRWRPWTPEEDAELDLLHNQQRLDYGKIAELMVRTRKSVSQHIVVKGWTRGKLGCRRFTAADDALIERMWLVEGATYAMVAEALGRSYNSTLSRVHRKGWRDLNPKAKENHQRAVHAAKPKRKARAVLHRVPDPATRPASRRDIASPQARVWTERRRFECAYPIQPDGEFTVSCCNPAPYSPYCLAHEWLVYARPKEASRAA